MNKVILFSIIFLINAQIVLAQSGLFDVDTGTRFAVAGIIFVLVIVIGKSIITGKFRIKSF